MRKTFMPVFAVAVVGTFAGCGEKTTIEATSGGTSRAAAPAASVDPTSAVGTWVGDTSEVIAMMKPFLEMGLQMMESMPGGDGMGDPAEATKKRDELKKQIADLEKLTIVMDLKAGGAAAMHTSVTQEGPEEATGTWTQAGDQVTVTLTTVNGKPSEGKKAKPQTGTLKDGVISVTDGPVTVKFKRK